MPVSKRAHEGYLLLDHRDSPGVPDDIAAPFGMPAGSGRGLFEAATFTCSHCEFVVVLNPDRTRERAWCKKCDHYLCDGCGLKYAQDFICFPFKARIAELASKTP